ncbi:hypothetical protein Dda_4954 [Drechslerella dactyloides]|uniref:Uncharacterized protein n=1 Tax=Drechslerella dactyloides TaxID=74499 RepID=A0AAD6NJU6_DREDA|nr:hypothetical protein Dda_4954 [Drechslerella dactyloides]
MNTWLTKANRKDVMNRVAGMTRLEVKHMCPRRGGKIAPRWHLLVEGDVVYIDYPADKIPPELKRRCEKDVAQLATSSPITPRQRSAIPIVSPKEAVARPPLPMPENTLIDLSNYENQPSLREIIGLEFLPASTPEEDTKGDCTCPELSGNLTPGISAIDPEPAAPVSKVPETASDSSPQVQNKLIRILFSFWFGKRYSIEMHPEGRIADITPILNAVLRQGNVAATVEQLNYSLVNSSLIQRIIAGFPFLDATRITAFRKSRLITPKEKLHNGDLIELLYDFQRGALENTQPMERQMENLMANLITAQADIRKILARKLRSKNVGQNGDLGDDEERHEALRNLADSIELARKVKVEGRSEIDIRIGEILGKPSVSVRLPGMASRSTFVPTHQPASRERFQRIVEADRERILGTEKGRKRGEAELFRVKRI